MLRRICFLPVAFALAFSVSLGAEQDEQTIRIKIRDRCDPATFNAAIGPGTCVGNGKITFQEFIQELTEDQVVGAWRFSPDEFEVEGTQQTLVLESRGGETHTFTKVVEFGGGFIPVLNRLSGNLAPRPECARVLPNGGLAPQDEGPTNIFVKAGTTVTGPTLSAGEAAKFQCCIHPWMRTTAKAPE